MKQGKLILQPMGGLANRMRVTSVLSSLCKEIGCDFEVWWAANAELGAPWHDLFEQPPFRVVEIKGNYQHAFRPRKWYKRLPHQLWAYLHSYSWLAYEDVCQLTAADTPENSARIREAWKTCLQAGETLFVSTGDNLGPVNDLSMFRPIASIQSQVETFLSSLTSRLSTLDSRLLPLYGLHIRRTDNTWAIDASPLSLFEDKISEILTEDNDAMFYLATDDKETITRLQEKFDDRIVVREKDFSRGTISGIQDAMVDMWILSRTKKIYGSFFSSFSEMASWIGNIELEVLKK